MSKHNKSAATRAEAGVLPEASENAETTSQSTQVAMTLAAEDELNWQFWTPDPSSGLDVAWAMLDPQQFRVQLLYAPGSGLGSPAAGDSTSPLIVDAIVGAMRPDLPFSLSEQDNPKPILSGSFNYEVELGQRLLSVRRLKYPGGSVDVHVLSAESGD